jgi:hypothetical protein
MRAWNALKALDLEIVPRYEGRVLSVEGDIVSVDGLIGKLGVEVVGVSKRTGRM